MSPGLIVLLALAAAFIGLSFLRVGAVAEYRTALALWVKAGPLRIQVLPAKPKKEKAVKKARPQKAKKAAEKKEKPKRSLKENLDLLRELAPLFLKTAGEFKNALRVERFYLDFTAGDPDPAKAAVLFGGVSAAEGALRPLAENNFRLLDRRVRIGLDFGLEKPEFALTLEFSITLGQGMALGLVLGVRLLRWFWEDKKGKKAERSEKKARAAA